MENEQSTSRKQNSRVVESRRDAFFMFLRFRAVFVVILVKERIDVYLVFLVMQCDKIRSLDKKTGISVIRSQDTNRVSNVIQDLNMFQILASVMSFKNSNSLQRLCHLCKTQLIQSSHSFFTKQIIFFLLFEKKLNLENEQSTSRKQNSRFVEFRRDAFFMFLRYRAVFVVSLVKERRDVYLVFLRIIIL